VLGGSCITDHFQREKASALKLDIARGIWSEIAPLPGARKNFATCAIENDINVFGGTHSMRQASVLKYNTVTNVWSTLAPMPACSAFHCAIALDGLVYLMGAGTTSSEYFRFDPASGVWTTIASPGCARSHGAVSFQLGGCLYVAGGVGHGAGARVERYDAVADTWTPVLDMLEGRTCFSAAIIGFRGSFEGEQDLFDALIDKAVNGGSSAASF
jgi:N-acetylneuraminic acid mutarotase